MKYWAGLDLPGNDIRRETGVKSIEECVNLCLANAECETFTYAHAYLFVSNQNLQYSCWLKKATSSHTVSTEYSQLSSGYKCNYNFNPAITDQPSGIFRGKQKCNF